MQITHHTDYAFRVLLYTASNPGQRISISQIAKDYDISKAHLMKVVPALVKHGYISSTRGVSGGITLALPPEQINVGAVFRNFESLQLVECFRENNSCFITPVCRLCNVFDGAQKAFLHYLDSYTLADLMNNQLANFLTSGNDRASREKAQQPAQLNGKLNSK